MSDQSLWYLENIDVTGIFCPKKLGDAKMSHQHKLIRKENIFIYKKILLIEFFS